MNNQLSDFLSFRRMVTPLIIQVLFWLGAGVCALGGLITFVAGVSNNEAGGALLGLLILIVGPFAVRIWCELCILFFRMNETLTEIRNNTQTQTKDEPA